MKHYFFTLIAFVAMLALVPAAHAQATTTVTIAHDFVVGGNTLPAGTYHITLNANGNNQVLLLRNAENGAAAYVIPVTKDWSDRSHDEVTLVRTGDVFYLSSVATDRGTFTFNAPQDSMHAKLKRAERSTANGK